MQIHSLGYRTDLFFPRFEGEILDRGDYIVIRTPSNPLFYWGNFLLFPEPPGPGDLERWTALFQQEISAKQETEHMTFGWDTTTGETGDVQPFLDAGFRLAETVVLATDQVNPPPRINHEIEIRQIETDEEWQQAVHLQVELRDPEHSDAGYLVFKAAKFARYREMHRAGLGGWFGAYLDGRLVADLGLFVIDEVGRFQSVETHPDFRRRGICGTLVHHVARYGLDTLGAQTLVMLADEHYFAAKIYESVGFKPVERQVGLEKWPLIPS